MDNQRLLVWAFFGMMAWLTYQAWMQDYGPKPVAQPAATETPTPEQAPDIDLPEIDDSALEAPDVLPSVDTVVDDELKQTTATPTIPTHEDQRRH